MRKSKFQKLLSQESIKKLKRFLWEEDLKIEGKMMGRIQEQGSAIRTFEVKEGFIRGGRFRITITFRGKVIKVFTKDTMRQARMAFYRDGYELIAWSEGRRRVCQDQNFE